jgi:cytochrome c553
MKHLAALCLFALTLGTAAQGAEDTPPPWAYPVAPPAAKPAAPAPPLDPEPKRVPGSDVALTLAQIRDIGRGPPDWHPNDHPPMPEVVAKGRAGGVLACGYCHLPNGLGRPENSGIAGLPVDYIVQQVRDFREGKRRSSVPAMGPPANMAKLAAVTHDEEVRIAAQYFASLPRQKWIRVVESANVPKTRVAGSMFVVEDAAAMEPIGVRIVEVPEDRARTDLRDSKSGFVAYVPPGSIKKGEAYVKTGGGKGAACTVCHGHDLRGLGPMPHLAGRSPSYIVRSLWDLQHGSRAGAWAPLMAESVAGLSVEDMVNIAAYAASLDP